MLIFPAIDLSGGNVVRLTQGDYGQKKTYSDDPVSVAAAFYNAGAKYLHVVDLDGAKQGAAANFAVISRLAEEGDLFIQVGGGIRTMERIESYLSFGVDRVILGTAAVKDPALLRDALARYGDKIAVGVDAKNGKVALSGWLEVTELDSVSFCKRLRDMGVATVIYTDISKDGALAGTNLAVYRTLSSISGLNIVASGGVSYEEEISALQSMNLYAAIIGKALYEGKLSLERALLLTKGVSVS